MFLGKTKIVDETGGKFSNMEKHSTTDLRFRVYYETNLGKILKIG